MPSEDNSADCLTKSIPIENLRGWLSGSRSSFLKDEVSVWDKEVDPNSLNEEEIKDVLEIKNPAKLGRKLARHGRGQKKVVNAICTAETASSDDEMTITQVLTLSRGGSLTYPITGGGR